MANNIKNNWINFRVYKYLTKAGYLSDEESSFAEYMHDLGSSSILDSVDVPNEILEAVKAEANQASKVFDAQLEKGRVLVAPDLNYPLSQAVEAVKKNSPFEVSDTNSNLNLDAIDKKLASTVNVKMARQGASDLNDAQDDELATSDAAYVFGTSVLDTYGNDMYASPTAIREAGGLAVGLYSQSVKTAASKSKKSFSDVLKERNAYVNDVSKTLRKQQFDLQPKENVLALEDESHAQMLDKIEDSIGRFLTKSEIASLRAQLANVKYSDEAFERGSKLLQHMYDEGYTFSVGVDKSNPRTVSAIIPGVTYATVRILDESEQWIGNVYQAYMGSLYYAPMQNGKNKTVVTPSDDFALFDFAMGRRGGWVSTYAGKGMPIASISGVTDVDTSRKPLVNFRLNDSQFRQFNEPADAQASVEGYIEQAKLIRFGELKAEALRQYNADVEEAESDFYDIVEEDENLSYSDLDEVIAGVPQVDEDAIRTQIEAEIGNYEDGFNPVKVIDLVRHDTGNNINSLMAEGLRLLNYDADKLFTDGVVEVENQDEPESDDDEAIQDVESETEADGSQETGDSFSLANFKNRLVGVDRETVKYMTANSVDENLTDFQKEVLTHTRDFLKDHGFRGEDGSRSEKGLMAGIDDNGIVVWQGYRARGNRDNRVWERVYGSVGQIFEPDEHGIVKTKFKSGDNYGMVPGYRGFYKYDDISKSARERLRTIGYKQQILKNLSESLRLQIVRPVQNGKGDVTNGMDTVSLNRLYHGDVYGQRIALDWYEKSPLSEETKDAIIETLQHRVRFDNKLGEFATTFSQSLSANADESQLAISGLVDNKNLRTLDDSLDGVFDKVMTATGKSQGLVRYLVDGTSVDDYGVITPADPDAKVKLLELDYFKNFGTNAWDREQMAANQLLDAVGVNENARVALMNAGGWTYDDGAMVSKAFAEKNMVPGHDGNMRPLMVGDKISDFGGNKATISIVVDADMSDEEAKEKNLENEVKLVRDNDLDVVMSSYSVLTRDNAGVVRELQDSEDIRDVKSPVTGEVVAQSGELNVIITNMLVDEKSHAYDKDALAQGHGRKFSSQLTWATTQLGAKGIMREAFAKNDKAWADMREYLIATGFDMGADGTLQVGYHPQGTEFRNHFDTESGMTSDEFIEQLDDKGGMLDLPFEIQLESGVKTNEMPVLSNSLRRKTELLNGSLVEHDYTKLYQDLFDTASHYRQVTDDMTPDEARDARKNQIDIQYKTQSIANRLQKNIIFDNLGGLNGENSKHSQIRDRIMAKRLPNSATAVITPDPRLELDKVVVGEAMYKTLFGDVENSNKRAAIFRDPILHAGSVRGVRVEKDTTGEITGMQVNPAIMKSFDGDFDGDSLGVWVPHTKEAQEELKTILAIENNLVDPISDPQNPKVYLNTGMDITAGAEKAGLVKPAEGKTAGDAVKSQLASYIKALSPKEAMEATNDFVRQSFQAAWGADGIMLGDKDLPQAERNEKVYESLAKMVGKGAKGNPNSLSEYKTYHEGKATRSMANDIQTASGVKSDDTGVAGSNSQKLMALMRDINPEAALEFTYVISQGTLQIKHDAVKAQIVDEALNSKLKNLFNGKPVNPKTPDDKLSVAEFKDSIHDIYENELGVDVREEHLDAVADVLSDGGKTIKPLRDLMAKKASPMDQIAYGGGFAAIARLARDGRSLAEGQWSSMMAPDAILEADEDSELVKKDTQDTKFVDMLKETLAEKVQPIADKLVQRYQEDDADLSLN